MSTDSIVFAFSKESSKDFGKKKRTNRSAKLKQCKLDARREQWLSQVKNKGGKEETIGGSGGSVLSNLETKGRGKDIERSSLNDSDFEGSVHSSITSILGGHDLGKDSVGSSRGSSVSSMSVGCYYESGEEEEEEEQGADEEDEDDGCADDWEAVADALTADDKKQELNVGFPDELETPVVFNETKLPDRGCEVRGLKAQCDGAISRGPAKGHAWRPDDAFRPQTLPTLAKQYSFPMNAERCCGRGAGSWVHGVVSQPTSCPICYEDLDLTDSSFQPCLCGFRLCLFCHKRILEADGRCPGCRKQYESAKGEVLVNGGVPPFRFTRSISMSSRS